MATEASDHHRAIYDRPAYDGRAMTDDRPAYDGRRLTREQPPANAGRTPPRIRVNVTKGAKGDWRPEITVESTDLDPLDPADRLLLFRRLEAVREDVESAIASWGGSDA